MKETRATKNILTRIRKHFPQVEEVEDSNQSIEIRVTENDADGATKKNPENCALARACIREKKVDGAIIGISKSYLVKGKKAMRFETPESVGREITSFDRESGFEPGKYRLSRVSPSSRIGQHYERRGGTNTGTSKPPIAIHRTENIRIISK